MKTARLPTLKYLQCLKLTKLTTMRLLPALALLLLPLAPARAQAPAPPGEEAAEDNDFNEIAPRAPLDLAALRRGLDELKKATRDGQAPADGQNAALLRFKIEQVELCLDILGGRYQGRTLYSRGAIEYMAPFYLARAREVAQAQGDIALASTSVMHERAYVASSDGSVQPYWIFVPRDYSPQKRYGLAVFLHGYGPDISKVNPWFPDENAVAMAHANGLLLALPYGRRNTDFVDVGEDDVLAVRSDVLKKYAVDEARTSLTGPSMGGFGVWAIGLHRPDLWAGLAPMAARTDF